MLATAQINGDIRSYGTRKNRTAHEIPMRTVLYITAGDFVANMVPQAIRYMVVP